MVNRSEEAREEFARLVNWLEDEQASWPVASLTGHARHVRLYDYGQQRRGRQPA